MHFWIDKHSQTCGYSGRHRVPTSLTSSGGGGRRWRGAKPMVTPVHRFQPIESVAGQYAHQHHQAQHHPHHHHGNATVNRRTTNTELPVRSHAVELDSSVFLDLPAEVTSETQQHPPIHIQPVNKHSRCGMRLSFALITAIIGGAKFYFEYQGLGIEVVYTLLVIILLSLCAVTMYRSVSSRNPFPASAPVSTVNHQAVDQPLQALVAPLQGSSVEEIIPAHEPTPLIEPPPPPYHIAVLLPQQIRQEDVPPPSYEKAVS